MRSLLALVSAAAAVSAQSVLDFSKLPACARQCPVLAQAEGGCVPPAAPVTNQAIYQSCVCQSALLIDLHQSGAQCQATGCSAEDAAKITSYYNALCKGPVVVPAPTTTLVTSTSSTSKPSQTAGTGAAGNNLTGVDKKERWIDRTWRWLVFIIVVVVAMAVSSILGVWWKRRHDRKVDARKANVAADPAPFTPQDLGTARSRPGTGFLRGARNNDSSTIVNGAAPTPPMTAISSNRALDTGVGAIAPPRQPNKLRSRSSTLQSLGLTNGSKANLPDPVAWGPHQYAAFYKTDHTAGESVPPSPTSAIMAPPKHTVFRNQQFVASETRFQPSTPARNWTPQPAGPDIDRPRTADAVGQGPAHALASSSRIPL